MNERLGNWSKRLVPRRHEGLEEEEIAGTVQRSNEIRSCYPLLRRIISTAGIRGRSSRWFSSVVRLFKFLIRVCVCVFVCTYAFRRKDISFSLSSCRSTFSVHLVDRSQKPICNIEKSRKRDTKQSRETEGRQGCVRLLNEWRSIRGPLGSGAVVGGFPAGVT